MIKRSSCGTDGHCAQRSSRAQSGRRSAMDSKSETTNRGWQKRIYLEAYRAANPNRDDPIVDYENGWWVFRINRGGPVISRVRTKEFAAMTFRLEDRVREQV